MEYSEDHELTRYVWGYYQRFMTESERRAGYAILAEEKAATSRSQKTAEALRQLWGEVEDPQVVETAHTEGAEVFRRRVRDRLLSERWAVVIVNRCPKCDRVVRTPWARQCFWCGFDWHS